MDKPNRINRVMERIKRRPEEPPPGPSVDTGGDREFILSSFFITAQPTVRRAASWMGVPAVPTVNQPA